MVKILVGDAREKLRELETASVHCCITSPPYWGLRDYSGGDAEIGLEDSLEGHIQALVDVFREVWRVLRDDGTLWLNYGDMYGSSRGWEREKNRTVGGNKRKEMVAQKRGGFSNPPNPEGVKVKDLLFLPARVAMALQADGWYVRSEIVWHKPNPMPESVKDRPTSAHEKIFLMSKNRQYYYDYEAVQTKVAKQKKANLRNVWTIPVRGFKDAHFATFPPTLIEPCIRAGCPQGGTVLDPFGGAGTTGLVADRLARDAILIELNPEYAELAENRIKNDNPLFAEVSRAK